MQGKRIDLDADRFRVFVKRDSDKLQVVVVRRATGDSAACSVSGDLFDAYVAAASLAQQLDRRTD